MDPANELARWLTFPASGPVPSAIGPALANAGEAARVADIADAHGLLGLWYVRSKQDMAVIPAAVAARAADAYYLNLARADHYYRELSVAVDAAADLGVPLVALKGAHLATALYPHIGARPMVDLDLLVSPGAVDALIARLGQDGLTELAREPREGATRRFEIQTLLSRNGAQPYSRIALHWDLFDFPLLEGKLPAEAVIGRAVSCELHGILAHVMSDEDLLVYLAAHVALHHQYSRLLWLCDIALLLTARGAGMNWDTVAARMRGAGLTLPCRETLRRVCDVFALTLPDEALAALDAAQVTPREEWIWRELSAPARGPGRRFFADLSAMQGGRRLAFAIAQLAPSPAYMRSRYGISRARDLPLAYVRRWWRGAATLGRGSRIA